MQTHVVSSRQGLNLGCRCLRPALPRPTCPARPRGRMVGVSSAPAQKAAVDVTVEEEALETASPFLEPLVRSFLLGVGAGIIFESGHVVWKFLGLAVEAGSHDFMEAVSHHLEMFSPLFVWDHVAALGSWVLLYVIEAIAIMSVLNRYPNDDTKAARTIRSMMTLPKRMLPVGLSDMKRAVYSLVAANRPSAATATAATPSSSSASLAASSAKVAATAVAEPSAQPLQFRDTGVQEVIEDIASDAAAPLPKLPPVRLPMPGKAGSSTTTSKRPGSSSGGRTLEDKRRSKGLKPGQLDPAAAPYGKRQKELIERRSYLKNFWYAAALSENLKGGKPLGVDILGGRVVLFRDPATKAVSCMDDTCPHRGAPLSLGWVAQDKASGHSCVVCPYHGWAFDGEGHLRDVPSAEAGKWPKRPLLNTYPVEERGGFIWLFYGDKALPADERPPIPFTPELEDPAWHAVYGEIEFDCGHWGVFENAIDMAHIHYLHNDSFGNSEKPRINDMATKRDTFHVEASFRIHNKPVNKMWEWTAVESVPVTAKAMLPSSSAITIQLGAGVSMITVVNTVPINENKCINRFALIRNFAGWEGFDSYARQAMFKILGEDKVMVEKLQPERLGAEFSLGPDAPQVAFRKLRQEWIDMGYGVLPESMAQRRALADM